MKTRAAHGGSLLQPARAPLWLRSRPFLFAGTVRWRNIHERYRSLLPMTLVLLIAGAGALALPTTGHALERLAQSPLPPFIFLAAFCAVSSARRKGHLHRSVVDSWLAPLAAPSSMLLRALLPPVLQLLLLTVGIAIPFVSGSLTLPAAIVLWAIVGAAYVVGSAVGWLSRLDKSAAAPDFHYVAVRRSRARWAQAPQLEPLSYWAVGQAQVYAKPKVTARAMLLVLLAIPLGTGGEKAVAIAAAAWVLLYVGSLMFAVVRVSFTAAQWLAPTRIGYIRFTRTVGYRALLAQFWVWAWVLLLTEAAGLPRIVRAELLLAIVVLLLSGAVIAVTALVAMRSAGMRPS